MLESDHGILTVLQVAAVAVQILAAVAMVSAAAGLDRSRRKFDTWVADLQAEWGDDDPDGGEEDTALHIVKTEARAA